MKLLNFLDLSCGGADSTVHAWIEVAGTWRIVCLTFQRRWVWFEKGDSWYDGPHRFVQVGPLSVYWNW
jgi:hypothetical protein